MNSRTFKTLPQCSVVRVYVSLLIDEFTYISKIDSVRWSVYVYQYLFMYSSILKSLTQCSVVCVYVSILVYDFKYIKNFGTVFGGQCMCINTCLSIHVHLKP